MSKGSSTRFWRSAERRLHRIYFVAQMGAILSTVIGLALVAVLYVLLRRRFEDARKMHEAETLREADRRKNEFLATLAHELRNPLAPIRNAVELLDEFAARIAPRPAWRRR